MGPRRTPDRKAAGSIPAGRTTYTNLYYPVRYKATPAVRRHHQVWESGAAPPRLAADHEGPIDFRIASPGRHPVRANQLTEVHGRRLSGPAKPGGLLPRRSRSWEPPSQLNFSVDCPQEVRHRRSFGRAAESRPTKQLVDRRLDRRRGIKDLAHGGRAATSFRPAGTKQFASWTQSFTVFRSGCLLIPSGFVFSLLIYSWARRQDALVVARLHSEARASAEFWDRRASATASSV